jgi:two-component system, sensor histidine kinase and response regulator
MEKNTSILIVDDNNKNLQLLGSILNQKEYKIAVATNGFNALKLASKIKPDLILLDVMMPEMDGFETCSKLKSDKELAHIPVIFLTAKTSTEDIVKGFTVGGIDYLTKPFNKEELLIRVKTQLELKVSREIIEEQKNKLELLNATKDKLFSVISHDLRSPLSNIKMILQLLARKGPGTSFEEFREYLDMLRKATDETYSLLENLLSWSKSQRGALQIQAQKIKLSDLVNQAISLMLELAEEKKIDMDNKVHPEILVFADLNMISTVIRNLVSNAIKFTPENGAVIIDAKDKEAFVEVCIADTGIGMSEENLKKIFREEEYFSTFGTNNEKGSGLGLNLCKEFVIQNKGEIFVESEEGKGSTFSFTLPKA